MFCLNLRNCFWAFTLVTTSYTSSMLLRRSDACGLTWDWKHHHCHMAVRCSASTVIGMLLFGVSVFVWTGECVSIGLLCFSTFPGFTGVLWIGVCMCLRRRSLHRIAFKPVSTLGDCTTKVLIVLRCAQSHCIKKKRNSKRKAHTHTHKQKQTNTLKST